MIKFDPTLLSIEIVLLKSVTTALGGSISVVNETDSTDKKEVYTRVAVPLAVARSFIQKTNKMTKYFKPTHVAVVKYDDHTIAMERHPMSSMGELVSDGVFGPTRWIPECESNIKTVVETITDSNKQWYFDGRYVYSFPTPDLKTAVLGGEMLTRDGSFRKVIAQSIDMQTIDVATKLAATDRSCLAFVTANGAGVVSPPIWKNLSDVGVTQLSKAVSVDDEDGDENDEDDEDSANTSNSFSFDRIDETLSVNLNFALKAGNDIGRTFGYECVEPLRLPQLMIELCTVNLPNIPKSIKATYGIGLKFTHTISWLLGMSTKANSLDQYIVVRALLKHLTKKGIFRDNIFDAVRVFKDDQNVSMVPLKSLSDLIKDQDITQLSMSSMLMNARVGATVRSHNDGIHSIATLMNDD